MANLDDRLIAVPDTDGELNLWLERLDELLIAVTLYGGDKDDPEPAPPPFGDSTALAAHHRSVGSVLAAERKDAPTPLAPDGRLELLPLRFVSLHAVDLATVGDALAEFGRAALRRTRHHRRRSSRPCVRTPPYRQRTRVRLHPCARPTGPRARPRHRATGDEARAGKRPRGADKLGLRRLRATHRPPHRNVPSRRSPREVPLPRLTAPSGGEPPARPASHDPADARRSDEQGRLRRVRKTTEGPAQAG